MTVNRYRPRALNGWQRLWVVYSLFWAAIFTVYTVVAWPTKSPPWVEYESTPATGYEDLIPKASPDTQQLDKGALSFDLILEAERRGVLPPDKSELLAEARRRGLIPPANGQGAASKPFDPDAYLAAKRAEDLHKAKRRAEALTELQQWTVVRAAVSWLAIVLGTYALGWSVAWVRRGFRDVG